jgi:hypothetical protein
MPDPDKTSAKDPKNPDGAYLKPRPPQRVKETSDERRARQRDAVANQQADLKREAAERRARQ